MKLPAWYRHYVVPAAVFQGVIIGGGYGTGREIIEFITRHGYGAGLLACVAAAVGFGSVLALSFALAVRFRISDYRQLLRLLIGRAWWLFEVLLVVLLVLVLAIVAAAAGEAAAQGFGLPQTPGTLVVLVAVGLFAWAGRAAVEAALSLWGFAIMSALVTLFVVALSTAAPASPVALHGSTDGLLSGATFALYNSALVPVLIYCVRDMESTATALRSGLLAGVCGVLPALMLHLVFVAWLPAVAAESLPTWWVLGELGLESARVPYFLILFGTIVLTAAGVLQGIAERLDHWYTERGREPPGRVTHAALAITVTLASILLARFGIVDLVARGYGTIAWAFFAIFTAPLLTRGLWLILKPGDPA